MRGDDNAHECEQGNCLCAGLSGTSVKIKLQYLQRHWSKIQKSLNNSVARPGCAPSCQWGEAVNKITRWLQLDLCRY